MHLNGSIWVLRLHHRINRDKRLTTHVALAARSLGSKGIFIHGDRDSLLKDRIDKVTSVWGGSFKVELVDSWKRVCNDFRNKGATIVHLTFKGKPLKQHEDELTEILKTNDILVVVGGAKVPPAIYNTTDYNISITKQPHSEVSALAIFIDHVSIDALEEK